MTAFKIALLVFASWFSWQVFTGYEVSSAKDSSKIIDDAQVQVSRF